MLPPFHLQLLVNNKEEVIAEKTGNWWGISYAANFVVTNDAFAEKIAAKFCDMLPKQMGAMGIDLSVQRVLEEEPDGLCRVTLGIQIKSFDLPSLVNKGMGIDKATFSETFQGIQTTLVEIGMEEKVKDMETNIGESIRAKIMGKLAQVIPEKMGEQGVKVTATVPELNDKPAGVGEVSMETALAMDTPFVMSLQIEDRNALLESAIGPDAGLGGKFKKFVASKIPDDKFNAAVARKLESAIPCALADKGINLNFKRLPPREDAGIVVRIVVESFDLEQLLTMGKGPDFAKGFARLMELLDKLASLGEGFAHLRSKKGEISSKISAQVRNRVQEKLKENLAQKLHARVTVVDWLPC